MDLSLNIWNAFNAIGGLALFILGMKIMSDGTQLISEGKLKSFLNFLTGNKNKSLFAGIGVTTAMQSSSAVSVLILSFINAGLLNLNKAIPLIVGANIGTTFKLWIISLGVEVHLNQLSLPLLALSIPFYFSKRNKVQGWATFVIGFSLIFLGLDFLRDNLNSFTNDSFMYQILKNLEGQGFLSRFYFLLIGIMLTFILQSSSASTSVIVVLYSFGIPLELCLMLILGANIGTTSTAQIAATVGNIYARYTAHFHTFFNVVGAIVFFIITPFLYKIIQVEFANLDEYLILASYHTGFNIITALFLFPFSNLITNWMLKRIHSNNTENKSNVISGIDLIHAPFSITPEMYIYEANKKLQQLSGNIKRSMMLLGKLITESDVDRFQEIHKKIILLEDEGDMLERDILSYLDKINTQMINTQKAKQIHNLINVAKELENIGDLAIKTSYAYLERRKNSLFITPKLRTHLLELQDLISLAITHLIQNINDNEKLYDLVKSNELEKEINEIYDVAFASLLKAIEKEKISPLSALYYRELVINYEIIGDHISKANKSLLN